MEDRWLSVDEIAAYLGIKRDTVYSGNLSAILFRLQKEKSDFYRRIVLHLRRMIPGFREFVLEPEGDHILLRWRGHDPEYIFGPHQLSDGSLRLMALVTLFQQPPEDINDSPITAPSKRIIRALEAHKTHYDKVTGGALAILELGLVNIRQRCPKFDCWLQMLESLADN